MVAEDLGEDPPVLQPPIQHLVTCPHPPLHRPILRQIRVVPRTFDFVQVAVVPLVGLDPLARLEEVPKNLVKKFNFGIFTCRVWTLYPHKAPHEDVHPQLVVQGRLPRILVDAKVFLFVVAPFWGMRKSMPLTVIMQLLSKLGAPNLFLKMICICRGCGSGGVRTRF